MIPLFALLLLGGTICCLPNAYATPTAPLTNETQTPTTQVAGESTYDEPTIIERASTFFGRTTEGLGKTIEEAFREHGRPNAYIEGQEVGGAFAIGVCYGDGVLITPSGTTRRVYWQGPSVGFDLGLNAAKVFVLVYHLPEVEAIFQRFPGVEGSLYYFAGFGMTYLENNGIVLAPVRLGVGFRTGASVGYLHITTTPSWNPF